MRQMRQMRQIRQRAAGVEGEGRERPRAASAKRLGPKAEGQDSQKKPRLCNIFNTEKDLKNCQLIVEMVGFLGTEWSVKFWSTYY